MSSCRGELAPRVLNSSFCFENVALPTDGNTGATFHAFLELRASKFAAAKMQFSWISLGALLHTEARRTAGVFVFFFHFHRLKSKYVYAQKQNRWQRSRNGGSSLLQVLRRAGASCTRINNPCLKKRKTRVSEFKWLPAKRLGQQTGQHPAPPPPRRRFAGGPAHINSHLFTQGGNELQSKGQKPYFQKQICATLEDVIKASS